MNSKHPHPNYRLFISVVALLAISVWLVSVSLYKQKQLREEIPAVPITPAEQQESTESALKRGSFQLTQQRANPQVGQPFELTITADSDKRDIVGYDVLLTYDQNAFTYVNAVSLVPSFSLVPVVKEGVIAITANKAPAVKTPTVFTNTDVIRVTFTAKKRGKTSFSVLPSIDNLKSRFVDTKLDKLTPRTSSLEVEIN